MVRGGKQQAKPKEVLTEHEGKLFLFEVSQALEWSMQKGCAVSIRGSFQHQITEALFDLI